MPKSRGSQREEGKPHKLQRVRKDGEKRKNCHSPASDDDDKLRRARNDNTAKLWHSALLP